MKKITLKDDFTFQHLFIPGVHKIIPETAIDVTEEVFMSLSQNPQSMRYNPETRLSEDYVQPFIFGASVAAKKTEIEHARDAALKFQDATVNASGSNWQVDPTAMAELNDILTLSTALGAVPEGIEWRDADNVNHPATLELLLSIAAARAIQKDAIWKKSWQLKSQVDALDSETATQADIDAIVVDFS